MPCKEATPYAPAASSPCPTGGRSASGTPASPPSSVSEGVGVRRLPGAPPHLGAAPVCPSSSGFKSVVDFSVWCEVRAQLCFHLRRQVSLRDHVE